MQKVELHQDYSLPVERVFAYLGEHENLGPLFGAKIKRLNDGNESRNGVGSARQLRIAIAPPFVETVTAMIPNELIEYRITKGSPLKNHVGRMVFTPKGSGCHLDYTIEFGSKIPGLDRLVKLGLESSLKKGLPRVDSLA